LPESLEPTFVTTGFPACGGARTAPVHGPGAKLDGDARDATAVLALANAVAHHSGRGRIGPVGASNNWVVCGAQTASGAPMLANDPHLPIDLPSNLYEFHVDSDGA